MAQGPAEIAQPDIAPTTGGTAWRDLRVRVASAAVLAPLGLAALWWGGLLWDFVILALGVGMSAEFLGMSRAGGRHAGVGMAARGLCYVLPTVVALIWLRGEADVGRANVLFLVLIVWASDIGAYLVGRLIGGPRLAPRVSPGKTWSGALGGLAAALVVGWAATLIWGVPAAPGIFVAGALGLISQGGDLFESALKRHFGVKDSGRIIPGHGGLLDRLDGLLAAAPAAGTLVLILGQGKVLWQ